MFQFFFGCDIEFFDFKYILIIALQEIAVILYHQKFTSTAYIKQFEKYMFIKFCLFQISAILVPKKSETKYSAINCSIISCLKTFFICGG